jgi:hypothetical protein
MNRPDFREVMRRLQHALTNNTGLREFSKTLATHVVAGVLVAEIMQHLL